MVLFKSLKTHEEDELTEDDGELIQEDNDFSDRNEKQKSEQWEKQDIYDILMIKKNCAYEIWNDESLRLIIKMKKVGYFSSGGAIWKKWRCRIFQIIR